MEKFPMVVRVVLGAAAVLVSAVASWLLEPVLGNMAMFLLLPGGAIFIWLNPELMRGD